jgi:microcystin-dependent protein
MSEPFIGQITLFAGNFAPRGWALCQGQILSIAQNTALFSILGTTYGGNGQTTFALPDLRGRVPMTFGQGPGLANRNLGEVGGTEAVTLLANQMPAHTHTGTVQVACNSNQGNSNRPDGNFPAADGTGFTADYSNTSNAQMAASMGTVTLNPAGGSQPVPIVQPFLVLNFIIALEGIFPSRN